jgi:tetratricopeptide (TPR) repeat protein
MSLSPLDPEISTFHVIVGDTEISLGHLDVAINEYRKAIDAGPRLFYAHTNLAAAYALAGKMDEATIALAEARRLNPAITVKWMKEHTPNLPACSMASARRGCGRSERRQRAAAGAMLVASRPAGLSALEAHYEGVKARAQLLTDRGPR